VLRKKYKETQSVLTCHVAMYFPSKLTFFIHPAWAPASSPHSMSLRCAESEAVRLFYLQVSIHSPGYGASI